MANTSKLTRRHFLWIAGGALGASMLMCGGIATVVATPTPALDFGASNCGKGKSMNKILVTYASRCGSTAEVAQTVADQLCRRGSQVDVCAVDKATNVSQYDAVVVGSAIRMSAWLPAAVDFIKQNSTALHNVPTAFFTVHILNVDDSEQSRAQRAAYVEPVHAVLTPQYEAFFPGKMDLAQLNFVDRVMAKLVKAKNEDLRNWSAIRAWGDQLFA
jgi:menaquinone-dependent protoporphyrinogen oxidase